VPTAQAERELLAPREDVWRFLAEPRHLPDWWPGIAAVEPDRRGFAKGGRWVLRRAAPGVFRTADKPLTLLVREVDEPRRFAFRLAGERMDALLELEPRGERTLARLTVDGPFILAFRRSLPRTALERLHALVQTAVTL
jgi:uncharacterized protein YndB with AHSA1/START domain